MGHCCSHAKLFYTESDYEFEHEVRKWEENNLKGFEYNYNYIRSLQVFNSNSLDKKKVVNFVKEFYGENMVNLVSRPFFYTEGGLVSGDKVKSLVYLLSRAEKVQGKNFQYYDKTKYFVQEVLRNEEDGLSSPIELNNKNFINSIKTLIDVSFEITKEYLKCNSEASDKNLLEIVKVSSDTIFEQFKQNLDSLQKENSFTLTTSELENRFSKDKWFLTPGYFRELTYNYLCSKDIKK